MPGARRPAGAAVDDEAVGILGHVGVEVVHEHAQGGFLNPALAGALRPARGADDAVLRLEDGGGHGGSSPGGDGPMSHYSSRRPDARGTPRRTIPSQKAA